MSTLKGSFSFIVAKRILSTLEENGPTKKTKLALNTRLNYNTGLKYIEMLRLLGWVDVVRDKWSYVTITKLGREINERLIQYSGSDVGDPHDEKDSSHLINEIYHRPHSEEETFASKPTIPLSNRQNLQPSNRDDTQTSKGKGNIMLVDDEPDILLTYRSFLLPSGYNVDGFSDPYSALQKVASSKPSYFDLIILDIRMPGINGLQLYQSLKVMTPSSKFLFVSSLDAARELVTVLPGVSQEHVLQKPIDKNYFVKRVESILSG